MTTEIEQARMAAIVLPNGDPIRELLTKLANRLEEQQNLVHDLRGQVNILILADELKRRGESE